MDLAKYKQNKRRFPRTRNIERGHTDTPTISVQSRTCLYNWGIWADRDMSLGV